jgi:ketosteroid isomerase-like protein
VLACDNERRPETRDAWAKSWNDKQLDRMMDLYDADAMLIPSDVDRLVGRDNIRGVL